ncbi:insulin-like peptide INSL5 [Lycaon pictus]
MKGTFLALFLFSVLLAISEARSEESMKLLWGLEYIKAVVYFCASSRWRRHPKGSLKVSKLPNYVYDYVSEESTAQNLPKVDSSGEESLQDGQLPTGGFWGSEKHWVMLKQDL